MRAVLLLSILIGLVAQAQATTEQRPNILFIFLDDFGWKDAGFMGSDFFETPHLDRLAGEGMTFTNAYAGAANCAPSRACLLSGQYSPRHQIFNVGTGPRGKSVYRRLKHVAGASVLDPNIATWADVFQQAGYRTASMGKWHLSRDPTEYGFDVNIGGSHSGGPPNGYYPPHRKAPGLEEAPDDEYLTDRLSVEADQFIRKNKSRPWLLYLTHFAVHTPLHARKDLVEKYRRKSPGKLHNHVAMATMIEAVDQGVGRITSTLEELKLLDQTVIIFSSDNGGYGPATDMHPLKGYKGTYYEGGIRVPFFVRWAKQVQPGTTCRVPITHVDVFPTLCDIAGLENPNAIQDGLSLRPLLQQSRGFPFDRSIYWHFPAYLQSYPGLKDEQRDPLFRSRPCSIIRQGPWKLHQYFETNEYELYHLENDIGETQDLQKIRPEIFQHLKKTLEGWQRSTNAPIPRTLNPAFDAAQETQAIQKYQRKSAIPLKDKSNKKRKG